MDMDIDTVSFEEQSWLTEMTSDKGFSFIVSIKDCITQNDVCFKRIPALQFFMK